MTKKRFAFPVGYHNFHKVKIIDFQLNRWHSWGYLRLKDVKEVSQNIKGFADWKREMIKMAEKAISQERFIDAAFFYRAAEFFVSPSDPDKKDLYNKFIDLFDTAFKDDFIRFEVPYGKTFLPAIRMVPKNQKDENIIVIHGGFDSYIEEFYSMAQFFTVLGYEVIAFEGPGQGAALKKHGLPLTHEWEKPTKAILDYFKLENITLLGISMGGYLCLRAAAFEQRIARVVAWSVVLDYMQMPPTPLRWVVELFLKSETLMNYTAKLKMKLDFQHKWAIDNLMYISQTKTSMDSMKVILQFNEENLHSDLIKQDVLVLSGAEDHFIPLKMHYRQVKALTNANSVTERVFTKKEQSQNHCQIGNIGLALDVISKWIFDVSP